MMKLMLCSYHSQIHDPTRVKVTGVVPPITPVASDLGSGLAVVHSLAPAVLLKAQAKAPPIVQHLPGGCQVTGRCPDYKN